MPGFRAPPRRTRAGTRTARVPRGRCGPSPRSWRTPLTGRQVRNRQRTDFDLADPANSTLGIGRCSVGTCPRLGDLQGSGACGAGQRGRFHRRLGHGRAARPGRPGGATAAAGRAAGVGAVRAQAGVSLVQRQADLPVPPRPGTRSSIARTTIMEPGSAILTLTTWPARRRRRNLPIPAAAWRLSSSAGLVQIMRSS
jgi:hypothetical protein